KGPLSRKSNNDDERKPAAGNRFHSVGPKRATAKLFGDSDLAAREIAHRWNGDQRDDEPWPGERLALSRPKAPKRGDGDVRGKRKKKAARDPAGPTLHLLGKRLAVLQLHPQPPHEHAGRGQLDHAIEAERR